MRIFGVIVGFIVGFVFLSQANDPYAMQAAGTDYTKPIAAVAAIVVGIYCLRSLAGNTLANFAGFTLLTAGFTVFLGPLVFPTPPAPVPGQVPVAPQPMSPQGRLNMQDFTLTTRRLLA